MNVWILESVHGFQGKQSPRNWTDDTARAFYYRSRAAAERASARQPGTWIVSIPKPPARRLAGDRNRR